MRLKTKGQDHRASAFSLLTLALTLILILIAQIKSQVEKMHWPDYRLNMGSQSQSSKLACDLKYIARDP
jgi:hypothetical protein